MAASFSLSTINAFPGGGIIYSSNANTNTNTNTNTFTFTNTNTNTNRLPSLLSSTSKLITSSLGLPLPPKIKSKRTIIGFASRWEEEEEEKSSYSGRSRNFSDRNLQLFVGNLPFSVDSAELAELFKDSGDVTMVEVVYDKASGRSRGFGFVSMATPEDVAQAAERFNGYEFEGRVLRVNSGPPPEKNNFSPRNERSGNGGFGNGRSGSGGYSDSANKLYVGNLPWGADNVTLEQLFSDHGKVMDVRIVYDRESGRSRGFGFVTMSSSEEMETAISNLDGADMDGRPLRVSVAEARTARF